MKTLSKRLREAIDSYAQECVTLGHCRAKGSPLGLVEKCHAEARVEVERLLCEVAEIQTASATSQASTWAAPGPKPMPEGER